MHLPNQIAPNSIMQLATCNWTIENFSNQKEKIYNKHFWNGDKTIKFKIQLLPNVSNESSINCVLVRVLFESIDSHAGQRFEAVGKIALVDGNGQKCCTSKGSMIYKNGSKCFTHLIISRNYLLNSENGIILNDRLNIHCQVKSKVQQKSSQKVFKDENIFRDFHSLLQSAKHADVLFVVGGKHFHLHKSILCARSPVFCAMFDSAFEECKQNRVELCDVDVEVFEELIRFIYTGTVTQMREYSHELLIISDKYQMCSLKAACEHHLSASLAIDSIIETLVLADMFQAQSLKSACLEFVLSHVSEIKNAQSGWKQLLKSQPHLLIEVLDLL